MTQPSQGDQVLARLRLNGSRGLSPLEALNDLGVFRLAARVHELRLEGHLIIAHTARSNGKSFSRYVLEEQMTMDEVAVGYQ